MAYDETSFLNGIILGRAMKGVSMANPNRGNLPRVLSGVLQTLPIVPLRPGAVPSPVWGSISVESYNLGPVGQRIQVSLLPPGDFGLGSLTVDGLLAADAEIIPVAAAFTGELAGVVSAAIRRKTAEGSWQAEDTPNGMSGTVQAAAVITTED